MQYWYYLRCELNAGCLYLLISNGNNNRKWLVVISMLFVAKPVLLKWYNSFNAFLSSYLGDLICWPFCFFMGQSHELYCHSVSFLFVRLPSFSTQQISIDEKSQCIWIILLLFSFEKHDYLINYSFYYLVISLFSQKHVYILLRRYWTEY